MRLGTDVEQAWSHPAATMETRNRIVRAVLNEIVVCVADGHIDLVPALARRRPHAAQGEEEYKRETPLDGPGGDGGAHPRAGPADAG